MFVQIISANIKILRRSRILAGGRNIFFSAVRNILYQGSFLPTEITNFINISQVATSRIFYLFWVGASSQEEEEQVEDEEMSVSLV